MKELTCQPRLGTKQARSCCSWCPNRVHSAPIPSFSRTRQHFRSRTTVLSKHSVQIRSSQSVRNKEEKTSWLCYLFGVLKDHTDPFFVNNFESIHKALVQVFIDKIAPCDLFESIVVERDGRDESNTGCEIEKVLLLCLSILSESSSIS